MEYIRPYIAAIAFGLLLTLVGHDALMTGDPHGVATVVTIETTTDGPHGGAGGGAAAATDHHPGGAEGDRHLDASTTPESDCGPTTGARPQPSHAPHLHQLPAAQMLPFDVDATAGFVPCWTVAPDHPPETRRALLQVYLN